MLYEIAHFLRDRMPWLWDVVDILNAALFSLRYGCRLKTVEKRLLQKRGDSSAKGPGPVADKNVEIPADYCIVRMRDVPTGKLVEFFAHQPEEAFRFFKPHGFDAKSIKKLQRNKAFLAYCLIDSSKRGDTSITAIRSLSIDIGAHQACGSPGTVIGKNVEILDGTIAGYCFNRSFFHGKGFRGRMVGIDYRGRGLGTLMNKILNEVGFGIGLRLFETVSKDNVASYKSALSASNVKVLGQMEDGDLYLEILKD